MNYAELSKAEVQLLVTDHLDDLDSSDAFEVLKHHYADLDLFQLGQLVRIWGSEASALDSIVGSQLEELIASVRKHGIDES